MPFDPAQPADNSSLDSAVMRSQLNSLKSLIDAITTITAAQVDGVTTGAPGDPATAHVYAAGNTLHFSFIIPQGAAGSAGEPGMPGQPGVSGEPGPQGPPFANAIMDSVNTLAPGEPATVGVSFDGINVHFTMGIPSGYPGPPGEVTTAALDSAIATTALNPASVSPLSQSATPDYDPGQMQQVMDKLDELLAALKRP